jgi:methylenetetrahydrofolate reductase (NADPH)
MSDATQTPVSFEFFPPKTPEGGEKLKQVRHDLYALKPHFFSVTYGAGGSTQEGTLQQVQAILNDGFDAAPHFSCIGATRDSVRAQLAAIQSIRHTPHGGFAWRFAQRPWHLW